jgi:hypothetical protein
MVYYFSIRQYGDFDADDLTYDLERMITQINNAVYNKLQTTNTNTL